MLTKDQISTAFTNARELVRMNHPKEARAYVLVILTSALDSYKHATTILAKAKTSAFLDRWIAVSKELYAKGVTPYVLDCFGLSQPKPSEPKKKSTPAPQKPAPQKPAPAPKPKETPKPKDAPAAPLPASDGGDIDMAGLLEEVKDTQGWCAEIFEKNKGAVAEIEGIGDGQAVSGTGFIISQNGYLLTNDHVVFDESAGAYLKKISMRLGGKKSCKIEVLFSDRKADIALCKFDPAQAGEFVSVKRIADYSALKQGADCLVIGNAFGMGLAPFSGVVRFTKDSDGNLVYTAPSNPGDSGGPVFNRMGECIGINKSRTVQVNSRDADGYANATPMDTINALLDKWTSCNNIKL